VWDTGGTDTFDASAQTSSVVLDLRATQFSSFETTDDVSIAYDVIIENAIGGSSADIIQGNEVANILIGKKGADVIRGGTKADTLMGDKGKDKLFGDGGSDTLIGGKGADKLKGGNGADTFVFNQGDGKDKIRDFSNGNDTLELDVTGIASINDVQAVAAQSGNNLILSFSNSDVLTLQNIDFDDLSGHISFA